MRAAVVSGAAPRTYFVDGVRRSPDCPSTAEACRSKAYLTKGDIVVLTAPSGPFACATFTGPQGIWTTNWLPAGALTELRPIEPSADQWVADWIRVEATLNIKQSTSGTLTVDGEAVWGSHDPERVRRGGVNTGTLEATVAPTGGLVAFAQHGDDTLAFDKGEPEDCRVRMRLLGPYIVVADNNRCGGMNVTFSGVYRRNK